MFACKPLETDHFSKKVLSGNFFPDDYHLLKTAVYLEDSKLVNHLMQSGMDGDLIMDGEKGHLVPLDSYSYDEKDNKIIVQHQYQEKKPITSLLSHALQTNNVDLIDAMVNQKINIKPIYFKSRSGLYWRSINPLTQAILYTNEPYICRQMILDNKQVDDSGFLQEPSPIEMAALQFSQLRHRNQDNNSLMDYLQITNAMLIYVELYARLHFDIQSPSEITPAMKTESIQQIQEYLVTQPHLSPS